MKFFAFSETPQFLSFLSSSLSLYIEPNPKPKPSPKVHAPSYPTTDFNTFLAHLGIIVSASSLSDLLLSCQK
ncbi:hypothetical protein QQP08_023390 [Theobroma cacao]|nr:hypothetical protein QQP08_023390 [Theobroma cacao]